MARNNNGNLISSWAFLLGVILAIIIGFIGSNQALMYTLIIIGLIVGLFNIADREVEHFLLSGAVLIIASAFGGAIVAEIPYLGQVFDALLLVFVPATIIVAIKNVFTLSKN